jgi:hypothetical protein
MIDEASHLRTRAESLASQYDCSGAIEAAQHCIELSVKSLYRLVGLEPPRTHLERMSKKKFGEENPLERAAERLEGMDEYLMIWLGKTSWIGRMWAWAHDTSLYGCLDLPASKLFGQKDAGIAIDYAGEALTNSRTIVQSVKDGRTKIKPPTG